MSNNFTFQSDSLRSRLNSHPLGAKNRNHKQPMKYNHVGIPTTERFEGEIDLPDLKMTVSAHDNNPFGIQWQRYWENAPYPDLVKTIPHVAFEVKDLDAALKNQKVIIAPNCPSKGLTFSREVPFRIFDSVGDESAFFC